MIQVSFWPEAEQTAASYAKGRVGCARSIHLHMRPLHSCVGVRLPTARGQAMPFRRLPFWKMMAEATR